MKLWFWFLYGVAVALLLCALFGCAINEKQPRVEYTLQFVRDGEPPIDFNHYAGEPDDVFHLHDQPHTTKKMR